MSSPGAWVSPFPMAGYNMGKKTNASFSYASKIPFLILEKPVWSTGAFLVTLIGLCTELACCDTGGGNAFREVHLCRSWVKPSSLLPREPSGNSNFWSHPGLPHTLPRDFKALIWIVTGLSFVTNSLPLGTDVDDKMAENKVLHGLFLKPWRPSIFQLPCSLSGTTRAMFHTLPRKKNALRIQVTVKSTRWITVLSHWKWQQF